MVVPLAQWSFFYLFFFTYMQPLLAALTIHTPEVFRGQYAAQYLLYWETHPIYGSMFTFFYFFFMFYIQHNSLGTFARHS